MPKLYEYFGLIVLFYSNEHEPVHVHAKCQGREARAEFVIVEGNVKEIRFGSTAGRASLTSREIQYFEEVVHARSEDIVQKWIDFFVLNKSIRPERITRRLK
jgi:hypothetical protein